MRDDLKPDNKFPNIELENRDKEMVKLSASDSRFSDRARFFTRILLSQRSTAVSELRRAPATRIDREIITEPDIVDTTDPYHGPNCNPVHIRPGSRSNNLQDL